MLYTSTYRRITSKLQVKIIKFYYCIIKDCKQFYTKSLEKYNVILNEKFVMYKIKEGKVKSEEKNIRRNKQKQN